ncbi:MAG: flagellin FliC [Bdellovibrionaceae bacterium]|nr:flagellin FliC [Pseudobdellovibrionaceae bacterium]
MMRISSNLASLAAQRAFRQTERETSKAMQELATGTRFVSPGANPAGLAISESLRGQVKGSQAALNNADNASSFMAVAEGAMAEQNNILIRLRELGVQAASDTLSDKEREFLDSEFTQLIEEFDRIAKSTKFGSQPLLDGTSKDYQFQVGINGGDENIIEFTSDADTRASSLDLKGLSVADKDDARDALETIDEAVTSINGFRAKLGATQSRLDTSSSHLATQVENLSAAYSKMSDVDIPEAVTRMRRGQVLAQYQAVALQAANEQITNSLRLIA